MTETVEQINNSPAVDDLHQTLVNEAEGYRLLVAVTERERNALQENSIDELNATIKEKETLATRLSQWAEQREQLTAFLANSLGLPPNVTLTDLISHFEETVAQKLLALREEFVNLVEQLILLNHGNQMMLQAEVVRVESTFDYIKDSVTRPSANYTVNGNQSPPTSQTGGSFLNWHA